VPAAGEAAAPASGGLNAPDLTLLSIARDAQSAPVVVVFNARTDVDS
jgi:hypothetical protein